jgi:hypothetical protein
LKESETLIDAILWNLIVQFSLKDNTKLCSTFFLVYAVYFLGLGSVFFIEQAYYLLVTTRIKKVKNVKKPTGADLPKKHD